MNTNTTTHIGVDVSKSTLDIYKNGKTSQITNSAKAIKEWLREFKQCGQQANYQINCESTGSYSRLLIKTSLAEGIEVAQINPRRIKYFSKVINQHAKTDKLDAKLIAQFSQQYTPLALDEQWTAQDELKQHSTYVEKLKNIRSQYINLLENLDVKDIRTHIEKQLKALEAQILKREKKLSQLVTQNKINEKKIKRLEANKGVGKVTSQTLLIWLPELGTVNRNSIAALAGLAPYNRDSGTKNKKANIQGGRERVRKALYMAALSAARCNPRYKPLYQAMLEKGKPKKVALIAIARKLLIELNTCMKSFAKERNPETQSSSNEQFSCA